MVRPFFKTVPNGLNGIALLAFLFLCVKILFLNSIPEFFPQAHELGLFIEGFSASIIASYFFYLVVVHKKKVDEKRNIYPHVKKWAEFIVQNNRVQLSSFAKNAEPEVELSFENLEKGELNNAFEAINPQNDAPLAISANRNANWFQYLNFYRQKSQININKILKQKDYIDSKLIVLVVQISDSSHFSTVKMLVSHKFRNTDMSSLTSSFYEYYQHCYKLEEYLENEFESSYVD